MIENKLKKARDIIGIGTLTATLAAGCSQMTTKQDNEANLLRDLTMSQTGYVQNHIKYLSCEEQILEVEERSAEEIQEEEKENPLQPVYTFIGNLFAPGYSCDSEQTPTPADLNQSYINIIDLSLVDNALNCGAGFTSPTITSPHSSLVEKYKAAENLVQSKGEYMPAIATKIRNCAVQNEILSNHAIAKASDFTSAAIWSAVLITHYTQGDPSRRAALKEGEGIDTIRETGDLIK